MGRARNDMTVGGEKGAEDARWTGKGQAREWDRRKWCRRREKEKQKVGLEAAWRRKGGWVIGNFGKALG